MAERVTKDTGNHDTIRRWVEERGGWPAEVVGTGGEGEPGILRIDFPGWSGEGKLRRIDWDDWFRKFDEAGLAFVYEERTASGERSNFNKLVGRETLKARTEGKRTSRRTERAGGGRSRRSSRSGARAGSARASSGRSRGGRKAGGTRRGTTRRGAGRASSRGTTGARGTGGTRPTRRSTGGRRIAARSSARTSSRRGGKRGR